MKTAQRLLDDPRLATLFAALAKTGGETRVIGGAVRDALAGLAPHEVDLATTALPEAVLEALVHAVEAPRPHARYHVTKPTRYMAIARRILPQRLLDHVLDKASDQ